MRRLFAVPSVLVLSLFLAKGVSADVPCDEWVAVGPGPALSSGGSGDDSGIGGTGRAEGDDSGIGGTGIYGAITQFGSLCVNGVRVHLDPETPIEINGRVTSSDALQIGHVVWVRADLRDQRLVATGVEAHSAVVGPVSAVDVDTGQLVVSDRSVRVVPDTRFIDRATGTLIDLRALQPGDLVDVSGLVRRNGAIVATRITRRTQDWHERYSGPSLDELLRDAPGIGYLSIEGFARFGPSARSLDMAGLSIDASALAATQQVAPDTRVWLRGAFTKGGSVRAEQLAVRVAPPIPVVPVPIEPMPEPHVPESKVPPVRRVPLGASDEPGLTMPPDVKPAPLPPIRPIPPPEPPLPEPPVPTLPPDVIEPRPNQELAPKTVDRP